MTKEETRPPPEIGPEVRSDDVHYPALEIDYALYEEMLKDSQWNDEQKREFIETMWSVIVSFVDLGFGIHPAQQAQTECEQVEDRSSVVADDLVSSWDDANDQSDANRKTEHFDREAS